MHTIGPVRANFSKDKFFFGKYYLKNIAFYGVGSALVLYASDFFSHHSFFWILCLVPLFLTRFRYIVGGGLAATVFVVTQYSHSLSWWVFPVVLLAIYVGHLSAFVMHNAAHSNFKPRWLNTVLGELSALQQLSAGLQVFRYMHMVHHAYPDDPIKDPHPPKGFTFWQFVDNARLLVARMMERSYLETWGDTEENRKTWRQQTALLLLARFSKTLFVFSLLGPKLFVMVFLPSYIANVLFFAAFNYFTHAEQPDGSMSVVDLKDNLYFDLCNRLLSGVMYHKSHHLKPKLFNPMKAASAT